MEYLYSKNENFEDFSSGRVLYNAKGIPNFSVRLLQEMYYRAKSYLKKNQDIIVYDPCCGGGYTLTILGLLDNYNISKIYGSDIEQRMIIFAEKNLNLLSYAGMENRKQEVIHLYQKYGKQSHMEALKSCERLAKMLKTEIKTELFVADCTKQLPYIIPDIILTDVPYGQLVDWKAKEEELSIEQMIEQLWNISNPDTILVVCMNKKQKIKNKSWIRIEKHIIGKRKFEIFKYSKG